MRVVPELLLGVFQTEMPDKDGHFKICWSDMDPDIQVLAVDYDYLTACFAFKLYHPDWEIIQDGLILPDYKCKFTQVQLDLTKEQLHWVRRWEKNE